MDVAQDQRFDPLPPPAPRAVILPGLTHDDCLRTVAAAPAETDASVDGPPTGNCNSVGVQFVETRDQPASAFSRGDLFVDASGENRQDLFHPASVRVRSAEALPPVVGRVEACGLQSYHFPPERSQHRRHRTQTRVMVGPETGEVEEETHGPEEDDDEAEGEGA